MARVTQTSAQKILNTEDPSRAKQGPAHPVWGYMPETSPRKTKQSSAQRVQILRPSEVVGGGGSKRVIQGSAMPVVPDLSSDPRVIGGPAQPVYPLNFDDWAYAYWLRVLETAGDSLIGYWRLDEESGPTAFDQSPEGNDGIYNNVDLGVPGIGDGRTAARFDGANDYVDIIAAAAAFNGSEGTLAGWSKVSGPGVWTDGATATAVRIVVDGANNIEIVDFGGSNNTFRLRYEANNTTDFVDYSASETDFLFWALTWSGPAANDELKAYITGSQIGTTQTGLGAFSSTNPATMLIGAATTAPVNVWDGPEAHIILMNRAASDAEISDFANVGE